MISKDGKFQWWSFGGLNEVGMNSMVFRFGSTVIPVDAGILFANTNDFGIQALYPDWSEFLKQHKPSHWVITHGHEDHIGAVPAIFSICQNLGLVPPIVVAPALAAALIRQKLRDVQQFGNLSAYNEYIEVVSIGDEYVIGDVKLRYFETRHSTPQACSLAFEWLGGAAPLRIIHTADFKLDEHRFEDGIKTAEIYSPFKGEAADILFIDSTNAEREGHSVSEQEILPNLEKLCRETVGRVYVTLFSSNVYRVASLIKMAQSLGRDVCLAGRSLQSVYAIAGELGLMGHSCPDSRSVNLLDSSEINRRPVERQFIICSGSQGEERSVLTRLTQNRHAQMQLQPGDRVIFSSKTIPGNEKAVSRLINGVLRQKAQAFWSEIAHTSAGGPIHASGHARRDEIKRVIQASRAKNVVPLHGELRQRISCAALARESGAAWGLDENKTPVVENGECLLFGHGPMGWAVESRTEIFTTPSMLRFESFAAPSTDPFIKIRRQAALGGIVVATLDSNGRSRVEVKGILPEALLFDKNEIEQWMRSKFRALRDNEVFAGESAALEAELSDELARVVRRLCGLKPVAIVQLVHEL